MCVCVLFIAVSSDEQDNVYKLVDFTNISLYIVKKKMGDTLSKS